MDNLFMLRERRSFTSAFIRKPGWALQLGVQKGWISFQNGTVRCNFLAKAKIFGQAAGISACSSRKNPTWARCFYFPLNKIGECTFHELSVDVRYSIINYLFFLFFLTYYVFVVILLKWLCESSRYLLHVNSNAIEKHISDSRKTAGRLLQIVKYWCCD